jgi:hypothetical protein
MAEHPEYVVKGTFEFGNLKDVYAYARRNGFTQHNVGASRDYLKKQRLKYPKRSDEWTSVMVHHARKDWYENNANPDMVNRGHKKGRNTKVLVLHIKRKHGKWLARIIESHERDWTWTLQLDIKPWDTPIPVVQKRAKKPKPIRDQKPEDDPMYLEIV